jgi:hypothetical protein
LTALELDTAKVRVMKSVAKRPGMLALKKGSFMKSRVALVAVLALGVFMSGTGASLAVSGFANTGSASSAQYPSTEHHKPHHIVEAANSSGNACAENGSGSGSGSGNGSNCTEPEVEAVEQVAVQSSSSSLPFTGFLAIPVLIVGLGLLGAGVVMRLRVRRGDHVA